MCWFSMRGHSCARAWYSSSRSQSSSHHAMPCHAPPSGHNPPQAATPVAQMLLCHRWSISCPQPRIHWAGQDPQPQQAHQSHPARLGLLQRRSLPPPPVTEGVGTHPDFRHRWAPTLSCTTRAPPCIASLLVSSALCAAALVPVPKVVRLAPDTHPVRGGQTGSSGGEPTLH